MTRPSSFRTIAVDPGVDPHRAFTRRILRADDDLHCDTTAFADDQGGLQNELVYPRAPRTITGV